MEVVDETENDFLSFCPFHGNHDSPAFSTSKSRGFSLCFNPSCAVGTDDALTLIKLGMKIKGFNRFEAKRLIMLKKDSKSSFKERFDLIKDEPEELQEFPQNAIEKMASRFWETQRAIEYMRGRGFEDETLRYFNIGFTPATKYPSPVIKPEMVVTPAYDPKGRPVGLVGRTIVGKEFKNFGPGPKGTGFHKSKIIWNIQNAKRYETVIIVESAFDAMRVHQAGYPNVVALLGGSLSKFQAQILARHFTKIINMTDDDIIYHQMCRKCLRAGDDMCQGHRPGRELGMKITETLPNISMHWACYDDKNVYARGAKDASDMADEEIRQSLRNSISHFEFLDWAVA